jgi:hypothetical protein
MRILLARCEIAYHGRATTRLALGDRVILFKDDGSLCVHADRGYKPLNYMAGPTSVTEDGDVIRVYRAASDETLVIVVHDVLTDEELHDRGYRALAPYQVVIAGTHPEYCSSEMWDAYDAYRRRGGRIMALGGDGWYWRVAYHPYCPGIMELRRAESGVRAWAAAPGARMPTGVPSSATTPRRSPRPIAGRWRSSTSSAQARPRRRGR